MFTRIPGAAPQASFFLLGPRGTGKSTWLRAWFPGAVFLDLLDDAVFRELSAQPGGPAAGAWATFDGALAS